MTRASDLADYADLVRAAATDLRIPAHVVEKDYYVTRALCALTQLLPADPWVFKGGTSLSKAFGIIHRFSEDIDLLFVRTGGENVRDRRLKRAIEIVKHDFGTAEHRPRSHAKGLAISGSIPYDVQVPAPGGSVIGEGVLLEVGYRGNPTSTVSRPIRSLIGDFLHSRDQADLASDTGTFPVPTLAPERTLVEKMLAVHFAFVANGATTKTRHYYDIHCLLGLEYVRTFLGTPEYKSAVVDALEISERYFGTDIRDFAGLSTSAAFNPDEEGRAALRRAYAAERELYFVEPPTMDEILARISEVALRL